MAKTKTPFARFVVRKDGGLMLGKSFGLLKPNRVYQIIEILGELIIKDMGPSAISEPSPPGLTWSRTANDIVTNGHHLHTKAEYKILCGRADNL